MTFHSSTRRSRLNIALTSVAGLALAMPMAAHAAAEDADSANDATEIVVTATKREGRLQDQPLAISAVTAEALSRSGKDRVEDILTSAPSFTMVPTGPTQQKVVLRGISAGGSFDAQSAATGFYLDDVPLSSSFTTSGTDLRLFDVARVEVLRGPQGTLYGGGSMGGTIKMVTNQPNTGEFSGKLDAGMSATRNGAGAYDFSGMINVPLAKDLLAVRLVGVYSKQDGFIRDAVTGTRAGGAEIKGVRGSIKWTPSGAVSITAMGLYQDSVFTGYGAIDTDRNHNLVYGDLKQSRITPEGGNGKTRILNLVGSFDLGFATLTSSSSYLNIRSTNVQDSSRYLGTLVRAATASTFGTPATLPTMAYINSLPDSEKAFIQEARLASNGTGPFSWIIGGFYQHDRLVVHRADYYDPSTYLGTVFGTIGASPIDLDTLTIRDMYAAFGEATYAFTPQLKLTAGLRYSHTRNHYETVSYGILLGRPTRASALVGNSTASQGHLSPKVTLSFAPSSDFMVYATVSEGFRPGGPNIVLPPDPATGLNTPSTFSPDKLWNYEIGAKSTWLDKRLVINLALFQMDLRNLQVVATRGDRLPYIANAGNVRSKGVELEVSLRPTDELTFGLAGAYTDDKFTQAAAAISALPGYRVAYVPKIAGSASVDWRKPISDSTTVFFNANVSHNSGAPIGYNASTQQPGVSLKPYTLGDIRIGASFKSGFEATLFVQNVGDTRGETFIDSSKLGLGSNKLAVTIVRPRTFGIKLSQSF